MTTPTRFGFMVLHSNRMEGLRDLLVQHVQANPLPPLAAETVLVQSNGMKHWLSLALASDQALGICAATRLVLPSAQLWQMYRTVLGAQRLPAHMPLDKAPLVWRIMRRLPHWLSDPRFAPLAHYLGEDTQGMRAFGLAQQLADVLDGYQNYRADWLSHWAKGQDVLDRGQPLPAEHQWQAAMWRDLLADVQAHLANDDAGFLARSDVHKAFMQALQQWPQGQPIPGLPPRLLVFGITALPMQTLEALVALGRVMPVLMFVHNPSQAHWGHLTDSPIAEGHPLLAAWGKHGRDYLHAIDQFEASDANAAPYQRVEVFIDPVQEAVEQGLRPSALQRLQSDILHLSVPPQSDDERTPADDSIRMAQAHSAQREVEVLHDRILGWLDADPQLQASDIMVMVPDMAAFAPHVHAVFGRFQSSGASPAAGSRHLPYAVADTTPHLDPVVQALQSLLQLPQLRLSLPEWLGLFQVEAVRTRYGLSTADVQQCHDWLMQAGVRWGLDADHRQPWGMDPHLPDSGQNSWAFGLQSLLLGYALGDAEDTDAIWQHTWAQAGVAGLDAPLMSGLLRWLRDMNHSLQELQHAHTPTAWVQRLQALVARFFKATDDPTQRLLDRILAPLEDWLAECRLAQFDAPLPLAVVRSHWLASMDNSGLQSRFIGGGVQFATLMPMRAIPFKVVCLLGMNDGDYPRAPTPRDFDLISHPAHGRAGDRARREDDRYLFLEAILSARERLYLSWQGRRASDHAELPPSVLVAQLLDHLNTCHLPPQGQAQAFETPLQPLQPFSLQYFSAGSGHQTYATDWHAALQDSAVRSPASAVQRQSPPPTTLDAQHLSALLRNPVDVYFQHHLQLRLDTPPAASEEDEPFEPRGLEAFALHQSLLYSHDEDRTLAQFQLQGRLALGGFGELQQAQMRQLKNKLQQRLSAWLSEDMPALPLQHLVLQAEGLQLHLAWGGEQRLWRQRADGSVLQIDWRPSKVLIKPSQARLHTLCDLWLGHLAANAAGQSTTSLQSGEDGLVVLNPVSRDEAQHLLQDLVAVYLQAWHAPLPLARKTACAWLLSQRFPNDKHSPAQAARAAQAAARRAFEGAFRSTGERDTSPSLHRAYAEFEDLWPGLSEWAQRVYGPLLAAVGEAA